MMTSEFVDLAVTHDFSAAAGELDAARLLADPAANDPLVFCRSQATAGLAFLTRRFDIRGYATSVHTACASGGQAVGTGLKLIRRGAVDRVLAGGFDSMISPVGIGGFCLLSALSPDNATPQRASRPFDVTRNGFLLGEGAGFLVLEEWNLARARGAHIYAELAGDGNSLSSYRITDSPPDGDGPIQAMRAALADAGATSADVDYLNAHGTSTPMNDKSESAAMQVVFGAGVERVNVSSTKSTMGHLIAAAGAVEVAVCALAIDKGEMPINANLVEQRPGLRDQSHHRITPAAGDPRGDVEFVRLRRLEQLRRAAQPVRSRRPGLKRWRSRDVLITGMRRRLRGGQPPGRNSRALRATGAAPSRRSGSGTRRAGPARPPAKFPTSIRARWSTTASCTSSSAAPISSGSTRRIARSTPPGFTAWRDALDEAAGAVYSDRTGVYVGSGGGNYQNQYDYFPLMTEAHGDLPTFGRELANIGQSDVAAAHAAEQRARPHRHQAIGLKGPNACITNHSVGGSLAVIEAAEALRNGEADRALAVGHDAPIEPQMVLYYCRLGLLATGELRPFDARRDGSVFGEGAGALVLETEASARERNATVLGEVLGGGYACEAQGLLAIRDDGDGLARAIERRAGRRKPRAGGRRHDRRARQRHAAVRCVGGRGDTVACSAPRRRR